MCTISLIEIFIKNLAPSSSSLLIRIVGNIIVKRTNGVNSATKKDLVRSISKSNNNDSKLAATGCLVASIALIGKAYRCTDWCE